MTNKKSITIGVAGLMSLELLNINTKGRAFPVGYKFPMISHLINGILRQGYKVICYTTSSDIDEPLVFEDERITVCIARRSDHPGRNFFKSERSELVELMKKYPSDIINSHWSYEFSMAALDSGIPTVVTLHDNATTILKYMPDPFRLIRWIMNFIVLRKAKYLTTNSEYLLKTLSKRDQRKGTVINNFFENGLEKHHYTGPRENYIVSIINGFGERKNVKTGLKAFALLKDRYKGLQFHLAGFEMEEGGKAFNWAKENGLEKDVVFLGNIPYSDVIKEIQKAKVLLHTSREESFCNVILEALVLGTPAIGGKHSGNVPFLLGQGKHGILCDINSPEEIVRAVNKIFNDKTLASSYTYFGYEHVVNSFSEDLIIKKYIEHLQKVYALSHSLSFDKQMKKILQGNGK
jgi:L-malate glycosyltransferase